MEVEAGDGGSRLLEAELCTNNHHQSAAAAAAAAVRYLLPPTLPDLLGGSTYIDGLRYLPPQSGLPPSRRYGQDGNRTGAVGRYATTRWIMTD